MPARPPFRCPRGRRVAAFFASIALAGPAIAQTRAPPVGTSAAAPASGAATAAATTQTAGKPRKAPASPAVPSTAPGTTAVHRPEKVARRKSGLARWLSPATAPLIPVPEIDEDPYSGTTVGVIPTYLTKNSSGQITRIYAPDVIHTQYFGWGVDARIFAFPSANTLWSLVGGAEQRVQSTFDGEYQTGILRNSRWSFDVSLIYDRNGTPHFYGIGNNTHLSGQTIYTEQQKYIETTAGLNLTHEWQLGYTLRARTVRITPGQLPGTASIQTLYPQEVANPEQQEILNRLFLNYDSRDNVVAPTKGADWVVYAGAASSAGVFNAGLYSEVGLDGRNFWSLPDEAVLAVHVALRYMPGNSTRNIPFWALSRIGGDTSVVGGDQILRGYGSGRFVGRNSTSISFEYRKRVATVHAFSTDIGIELTPFIDLGQVFNHMETNPVGQLHKVYGFGVRGLALPFVVGYVDVGFGREGPAVFTGLNYPF